MNNYVFILFILVNSYLFVKSSDDKFHEVNFYVFYLKDKNVFVCSRTNELNTEFGRIDDNDIEKRLDCLIDIKSDVLYKVKFFIKSILFKTDDNRYHIIDDSMTRKLFRNLIVKIGDKEIIGTEFDNHDNPIIKQVNLKLENYTISYSTDCKDGTDCHLEKLKDTKANESQENFSFDFYTNPNNYVVLLEKQAVTNSTTCNSSCVNGICKNSTCYCKNGYIGANCSFAIPPTEFKISSTLMIILFITSILLGVLIAFLIFWLCLCICHKDNQETSREVDIIEHWSLSKA